MINHFGDRLVTKIRNSKSFLCLGVDPHLDLMPKIFDITTNSSNIVGQVEKFCFSLLDVATGLVPAIKPQIALFEQLGPDGMKLLSSLCKHAQSKNILVIMIFNTIFFDVFNKNIKIIWIYKLIDTVS